jgi:hypothetical protein
MQGLSRDRGPVATGSFQVSFEGRTGKPICPVRVFPAEARRASPTCPTARRTLPPYGKPDQPQRPGERANRPHRSGPRSVINFLLLPLELLARLFQAGNGTRAAASDDASAYGRSPPARAMGSLAPLPAVLWAVHGPAAGSVARSRREQQRPWPSKTASIRGGFSVTSWSHSWYPFISRSLGLPSRGSREQPCRAGGSAGY